MCHLSYILLYDSITSLFFFFFFQAEDGIRDVAVTGVQTCALPIFEFIHTATLVHDDVIDEAELRRGRGSLNARWGNGLTVLLGDYLYIKSMNMALAADDLEIIKILAEITLKMIEGELIADRRRSDIDIG